MKRGHVNSTPMAALADSRVFLRREDPSAGYRPAPADETPIELPTETTLTRALVLLRHLFADAALDAARHGTAQWNPLGDHIAPGQKVLLKPNWVLDDSRLPDGDFDCLVTHPSVIEAVLHYVVKARPGRIIVGDAPLQDCDFDNLSNRCGLDEVVARFKEKGHEIQIRDFRLTRMEGRFAKQDRLQPDPERYCLFDLGDRSWLSPLTTPETEFRVTKYNPELLKEHHRPGVHRYLIVREAIDADVVISLPKLKTHKKAGVTGALKNMVGINGFKEYLPHHRKGGAKAGGDCYQGGSLLKKLAEDALDRANASRSFFSRYLNFHLAGLAVRLDRAVSHGDGNLDGGWHGNDTVWRMCLDLQRILHYGTGDGLLSSKRRRTVLTITDAIVAGEGEGPLAPSPVPLGIMTMGTDVAALEWIHCLLMGLEPERIQLVAHAFDASDWPLTGTFPKDIGIIANGKDISAADLRAEYGRAFSPPAGWRGHCEMSESHKGKDIA